MFDEVIEKLKTLPEDERIDAINDFMNRLREVHPIQHPVSFIQWIKNEQVTANDYNPNVVAPPEMRLLFLSVKKDGYTQPIVAAWNEEKKKYVVGDGFHRNRVGKEYGEIKQSTKGYLPVVPVDKTPDELRELTIRHNRARGKHTVLGMTNVVKELIELGLDDVQIAKNLGMDADEVLRLKQTSGIADLFKNRSYSKSWRLNDQ